MPYNLVADSFHTKKLCSRYSSSEVRFYTENGRFVFLSTPTLGGLGAAYDVHLMLIEKLLVDFLLVIFEFFRVLRRYTRISIEIDVFAPTGSVYPTVVGRRSRPHQPFSLS